MIGYLYLYYYHYFYSRLCAGKFRIFYKLFVRNRISSSFISKCFEPVNLSQNTSINKQKSAHGKQIRIKVSKPIPNKSLESGGQKTRHLKFLTLMTIYFPTSDICMLKVAFE